nr:polysaccharide biosynthesis C-terminal domain-containing protein [Bacteroidota bacterium]
AGTLLLGILIIWQTNRRLGMQSIFWAGSAIMIFGLINLLTVKVTQLRNLKKPIVSAKKLLSYGLPLALAQLSVWLFSMSDTFLLKVFHDNATVGIFSVVNGLINRTIHIIPVAIMLAAWPTLVKIFRKSGWPLAVREHASQVKIYLFIMLPVIFVFLVFAKSGYQLFVHEKYWAGTIIILPLTIGTFLLGLSQYYLNTFNLAEQSHKVTLVLLVTGGLKVIISFCLVPHYSYIGASWATCIAYGILAFWSIYWSHRTFGVNLPWQKG